jgi:hypothetical protein
MRNLRKLLLLAAVLFLALSSAGAALPAYAQERPTKTVEERPPTDIYQLVRPRFLLNGRFVQANKLPKGDIILVAGVTKEKDLVRVFTNKGEFLKWASQAEQGDALIRATREMDERGAKKDSNDSKESELQHKPSEDTGGVTPMAGVGWLYNGYNYSGAPTRPVASYPKLSWVNLDNKVSSVWVAGLTVLCDSTWYGGSKIFLLAVAIPDLKVLNFDNRASSIY